MRQAVWWAVALMLTVFAGCFDPAEESDPEEILDDPVRVDEFGRTVTEVVTGNATHEVHAAAGALSELRVLSGATTILLPQEAWLLQDGRLIPEGGGPLMVAAGDVVTFLLPPFAENLTFVADAANLSSALAGGFFDPNAGGEGPSLPDAVSVASPYNETATLVSGARVYELLEIMRDDFPHRTPGEPNYELAQDYYVGLFEEMGYDIVVKDPYGVNDAPQPSGLPLNVKPQSFANVWAYRPGTGTPDRIVAFGGHYDIVPNTVHGAFDDTSGTMMTLALAEAFSEIETDVGLLFGLWGGEENGLMGSNFFVRTNPDLVAQTILYVNLDVSAMAWPGPNGAPDPMLVSAGPDGAIATDLMAYAEGLFSTYVPEMPREMRIYEPIVEGQTTGQGSVNAQSDHTSFMTEGVPVYFPFTSNVANVFRFIHGPQDTLYNMTWYMATAEVLDVDAGVDPPLTDAEFETGRDLLMRSFETFMALPFYAALEIDAGLYSPPKDVTS